jgi:tetratricopeptide (TPR) repeat protein
VLDAAGHAIALDPEDDWPHRLRSIAFQDLGVEESAIAAAREAVRVGPHSWPAHSHLAQTLVFAKRDLDEAAAAAERGVALAPHEPDAHYALGMVADARGKHRDAEEHFRRALALDPQHGASHNALARRRLASRRFDPRRLADAASGFRTVVQADPRADYAATNLELVLRVFLARLSYLIFVVVYIAARADSVSTSAVARIAPLALLAIPIAFAAYFLVRLEPDLRGRLFYIALHGRLAAASIAQACALALLVASAAAPSNARLGIVLAAVVSSIVARILLAIRGRGRIWSVRHWREKRLSLNGRWILAAVVVGTILLLGAHSK